MNAFELAQLVHALLFLNFGVIFPREEANKYWLSVELRLNEEAILRTLTIKNVVSFLIGSKNYKRFSDSTYQKIIFKLFDRFNEI